MMMYCWWTELRTLASLLPALPLLGILYSFANAVIIPPTIQHVQRCVHLALALLFKVRCFIHFNYIVFGKITIISTEGDFIKTTSLCKVLFLQFLSSKIIKIIWGRDKNFQVSMIFELWNCENKIILSEVILVTL